MPGPWEKYQKKPDSTANAPWSKYAAVPAKTPDQPDKSLAEGAVALLEPPTPRPRPKNAAEAVTRLTKDTIEGFFPPTSFESAKRFFSPSPGNFGPLRSGEDVASYGREDINKMGDQFMETNFAQKNPRLAAAIATGGTITGKLAMMSPSDIPAMTALQGINPTGVEVPRVLRGAIPNAIDAEMAVRGGAAKLGKKAISAVFGPSREAVEARFERPGAIKSAKPYDAQSEELAKAANTIEDEVKKLDKAAWEKLSRSHNPDEGAIPRSSVEEIIKKAKANLQITGGGALGGAQKKAVKELSDLLNDLPGVGAKVAGKVKSQQGVDSALKNKDFFSQSQVKEMIQAVRANVKFGDPDAGVLNEALQSVSEPLDDLLKAGNQEYAKAMLPVADRTRLLKDLRQTFNLKDMPGQGATPTDTTASKLKTSQGQNRSVTRGVLRRVKGATGKDFNQSAKDFELSQQFVGGSPNGARRVAGLAGIGGALGRYIGGPELSMLGAGTGAGMGLILDTSGREMAGGLIDFLSRLSPGPSSPPGISRVLEALGGLTGKEQLRRERGR